MNWWNKRWVNQYFKNDDTGEQAEGGDDGEQMVDINIDGEVTKVPLKQVIASFQKGGAADKRLADANKLLADSKNSVSLAENIRKAVAGDKDAFLRVARDIGVDEETALGYLGGEPKKEGPKETNSPGSPELAEMVDALKKAGISPKDFALSANRMIQQKTEAETAEIIWKAIAQDSDIGYTTKEQAQGTRVASLVRLALNGRLNNGGTSAPEALRLAIQDVKALLKDLGIQKTKPKQNDLALSLGPTADGVSLLSDEPKQLKNPGIDSGDKFNAYVLKRIAQELRKDETGD